MAASPRDGILACTLTELEAAGHVVVRAADRPVVVFHNDGAPCAVDNRCPHMGFPLHRGSCEDGMITCHWHHARFDAASGCTFDLFADDVPGYDVQVRDGSVYISSYPRVRDVKAHATRRLRQGLEMNVSLVSAKAILALRAAGVDDARIVRQIALFGLHHRDGWGPGMTVLAAAANLLPDLADETAYLALYQGARRVAADCAGQTPRRDRHRLDSDQITDQTLDQWLSYWTMVRHRDGAERTLLTAIASEQVPPSRLVEMLCEAATQRYYADTGHLFDFTNKALELLDVVGHEHAEQVLPPLMGQLVGARGGEEANSWRHPIDLVPLIESLDKQLDELFERGRGKTWQAEAQLADDLLQDDPEAIMRSLGDAIASGARPQQLSQSLAYAAALRVARFGTANEFGDWIAALHSFSYCNAVDQMAQRADHFAVVRAVVHGAMTIYLNRFLNVPPAKLPEERRALNDAPSDAQELLIGFLETLDGQQQVDRATALVHRYLALGHDASALIDTLAQAVLREDFDFHSLQMLEAGVRQYRRWGDQPEGHTILIAVARYLAAHSPTQRAQLQTARIALRLHRGEDIYEDDAS